MRPIVGRRYRTAAAALGTLVGPLVTGLGCSRGSPRQEVAAAAPAPTALTSGLILREAEGERRTRRPRTGAQPAALTSPVIIKVDGTNGGSTQLFMGYEDVPPGEGIPQHYHPRADEILFIHRGRGVATLGERQVAFDAGTTIYIPHGTRVSLRNTGEEPIGLAFVFADPTMSGWFRDGTAPEGQSAPVLTAADNEARRARHREHIVFVP